MANISKSSPIKARPSDRDPLRNFKFVVQFVGMQGHASDGSNLSDVFATGGFISVSGIGISTDTIPYREGGDNTITRKLPGQSDVGALSMVGGVFAQSQNPMYEWFKQIFVVQWGSGNAAFDEEFRCDCIVNVLKHPVTKWSTGGVGDPTSQSSAGMSIKYYNCWPSNLQYNDLNAGDNSIMISSMTLQHEGFDVKFGANAQTQWT